LFKTLAAAWQVIELRKKIIFTLLMFLVFRIGAHIPVPGIDPQQIAALMGDNPLFGFVDVISGGAFKQFSIFAMGIIPYINASIIINLLTMVVPYFEKLAKEGPEGRKKMAQFTRYGAVLLGFCQAVIMAYYLRSAMLNSGLWYVLVSAITLTAGTAFLMWIGELITEKGIGNGISLIIFTGIVSRLPSGAYTLYQYVITGETNVITIILFLVMAVLIIAGIVFIQEGERRIPVHYAKRNVGRKMYGGQSTHIPMKLNQSGVIPIIFAMSLLMFPATIAGFFAETNSVARFFYTIFQFSHPVYMIVYALLIFFFTYFYTAVTFNTKDIAENIQKYGGAVPGLRPGHTTAEYLDRILSRVTFAGALFLTIIALLPSLAMGITKMNLYFGGTSLLIAVGVALDTMKQIDAHLISRSYQGFMK
jgi:preprotein translocase subunit SecY